MINRITFTGREDMLTQGIKKTVDKTHEYINEANIFSNQEIQAIQKEINKAIKADTVTTSAGHTYTSPFDVTGTQKKSYESPNTASDLSGFNIFG